MNRFVLAIALACALSGTALAGDIHTAGAPAPGETPTGNATSPGEIHTTGEASPGDMGNGGLSALLTIFDLVF
jgi:hypothetical protein